MNPSYPMKFSSPILSLDNELETIEQPDPMASFYKHVYLNEIEADYDADYDLNEADLSDSDQTESCFSNEVSIVKDEPVKTAAQNQEAANRKSLPNVVRDKISCIIWEENEWKGADLSMSEISSYIQINVKKASFSLSYFYIGIVFSALIGLLPIYFHNCEKIKGELRRDAQNLMLNANNYTVAQEEFTFLHNIIDGVQKHLALRRVYAEMKASFKFWSNIESKALFVIFNTLVSTIILCILFFSILTIADRTLNQRFLHAKYFCYLTSIRRAKKHSLPHFRLGRVENIKMWLSLRSFMKRRGPQRSIDAVISSTFLIGVGLCSVVCIRFLQDADFLSDSLPNWQLVVWCLCIWTYMLRFMTIGFKINKKYRNCMSMVITEQINLYLQMEKMPDKKDEFMVVNNVLKLAADLLKEIENPFKISGLGVDPWVYNITKVVILSAFSAVMSELLGFKLKLYKIKIS